MIFSRSCVAGLTLLLAALLCAPSLPAQQVQPQQQAQPQWKQLNAQVSDLYRQGKYAEALPIAVEALKSSEAALGPDDAWLTIALNNLAMIDEAQSDYANAEPLYQRALHICEKAFGTENPLVSMDLKNLGHLYFLQGKFAEAEPLFERALHIDENSPGAETGSENRSENPHLPADLSSLAMIYVKQGKYAQAEPLMQRALPLYEKSLGPDHPDLAQILNNLAHIYDEQGKYADAEPLYLRALSIREKALGLDHPDVATVLNNLAALYANQGRYAESEPLYLRALAIDEKALGPDDPAIANTLNNLAALYDRQGRYAESEPLHQRALRIDEKALGADDPGIATDLNNLALFYLNQGQYAQAEPLLQRVLKINEKALGPDHRNLGAALNNLAALYVDQGKYANAESLYQRALGIYEKALGPDHPEVAVTLNNLAALYMRQGKYADADSLYQRALDIREKALGPDHPDLASALNNLAALRVNEGNYAGAEVLYKRALSIYEKALGPNHPDLANALNNLAQLYFNQGKYADAEPLYKRALSIDEKAFGPGHPGVAIELNNLALFYDRQGKYASAEPLYQRALSIDEKALGPDHPSVATDLNNLAMLFDGQGNYAQAEPVFQRAFDNIFDQFQYNFTYMTEKERLGFLDTVANDFPVYFSFVHRFRQKDPRLIGSMYNLLLWEKGFVVGSVADMRRWVEASGDAEAMSLLAQLTAKRTRIAALLNAQPSDRNLWRKQIDQLRTEADGIEKALVARSSAFAEQKKLNRATWQQVRDALQPGEAAVEFARFDFYDKKWTDRSYYAALVVTRQTKAHPRYIFLGAGKQIEGDAITHFQQSVQTRGFTAEGQQPETALPGADAYALIWKPLETALAGTTRIYLSPDGVLNQLPLGIIPTPGGKLQMEKYDLRLLSSTRDILRSAPPRAAPTALLVGNPVFDLTEDQQLAAIQKLTLPQKQAPLPSAALPANVSSASSIPNANPNANQISRDQVSQDRGGNNSTLPPLPGTGLEVNAIAQVMLERQWKTSVYTGDLALKRVVEQAGSPRVVHLATHGFFLPDQINQAQLNKAQQSAPAEDQPSEIEDPMLRSGLYFAGANRTLTGQPTTAGLDNGVLTALEASNLNLTGTELVVLSACNTGQGDVKNGEGVFGLRRALQEAGAQHVLMSLWSVPDEQTLQLMQLFYTKWLSGTEIHEALKQAQLEIREQVKNAHDGKDLPYYWGAFVLVGR